MLIKRISSIKQIDGHKVDIGCSVGISLYPEHGDSSIELPRSVDIAMYATKDSGCNRYCSFSTERKVENQI